MGVRRPAAGLAGPGGVRARGWNAADRLAVVQYERVATFLLKRTPFTPLSASGSRRPPRDSEVPDAVPARDRRADAHGRCSRDDYARLILAPDRQAFYRDYPLDVSPTTDDRPFFFHTTKLRSQRFIAAGLRLLGHPVERSGRALLVGHRRSDRAAGAARHLVRY